VWDCESLETPEGCGTWVAKWCPALVAIDINGRWTHLGLGLGKEGYPERMKNREPLEEKPRGWRIRLEPGWGELVDDAAFVPEAVARGNDGHLGDRHGMVQLAGPGRERMGFFERQMDGPGEGLRAKCRA